MIRTHGGPYTRQARLFPINFIDHFKEHPNEPQNIPTEINNNV